MSPPPPLSSSLSRGEGKDGKDVRAAMREEGRRRNSEPRPKQPFAKDRVYLRRRRKTDDSERQRKRSVTEHCQRKIVTVSITENKTNVTIPHRGRSVGQGNMHEEEEMR
jgi:hypothetical protein